MRRAALRRGGMIHAAEEATRRFGLPVPTLSFAKGLTSPLYVPARVINS